jgi:hypothetical protein
MGMGRGAEILIVPFGAMAIFTIAAVLAAFFHRTAARMCAGAAIGLAVLLMLAILAGNHWNPLRILNLLMEASPPILVLFGCLILSMVAAFAPLRHPKTVRPDGRWMPARPRWSLFALALGLTLAGTLYGTFQLVNGRHGEEKTRAMLAGNASVRLKRMQIDYQQRRVICNDPEVLRYLESRFRSYERDPDYLGTSYQLTLTFEGGGCQSFASYWTDAGDFNFFLGEPGEGGTAHGIRLPQPRPRGVEELVRFLAKPYQDVSGSVLILEEGGSRIE